MNPERWREIERIYNRALELDSAERRSYIERACRHDQTLRNEVEGLLARQSDAERFLNSPAMEVAARALAADHRFDFDSDLTGRTLLHYRITAQIGAGGMGVVYKAQDTHLNRPVAIKVLPEVLAGDAERLGLFEREARLLGVLSHPNIAPIHGLEKAEGRPFLVLELVEGLTLAERLKKGPIPVEETLEACRQVAGGLETAHDKGIIHRDLKPANIKLTAEGQVKILDFGLAKALHDQIGSEDFTVKNADPVTVSGVILGTASYMSPEQAKGRPVDRRADIWAFGCVLYEMLTGELAFRGNSVMESLTAVMNAEPDWTLLPAETPQQVLLLLRRCLQKDVRRRLQAIGEARIVLEDALSGTAPSETALPRSQFRKARWAWALAGIVIGAALTGLSLWNLRPLPFPPPPVTRFTIVLPPGQRLAQTDALAVSPDGNEFAYVATAKSGGQRQIYLYTMETGQTRPISGTEGARSPFFSPDGQSLGFVANAELKKISLNGGVAQKLTDLNRSCHGATWSSNHTIAFAPYSSALQQISDDGGTPQALSHLDNGETYHVWPQFLPGGRAVLFEACATGPAGIGVQMMGNGERKGLIQGQVGEMPSYVPSGHLTYLQAGNLMAVPFDLKHLEVAGTTPVVAVRDVSQYVVSATGSLVYAESGNSHANESHLVWVDGSNGREEMLPAPARSYNQPRISPDGRQIAVDIVDSIEDMQVWLYDLSTDNLTPFTFEGVNRHAIWAPHSERIAFVSNRKGPTEIFWKRVDGSGGVEQLTEHFPATWLEIPYSISSDGKLLTYVGLPPAGGGEFWVLSLGNHNAKRVPLKLSGDGAPQLSPDGRWVAFVAADSHQQWQVYVRAFPGPGGLWQISTDGGNEPQWNPNGRELFYRHGDKMMAVDISFHRRSVPSKPRQLFEGHYQNTVTGYARANYDVSPDGRSFLMLKPVEEGQAKASQIKVVLNWSEELKRLVPTE